MERLTEYAYDTAQLKKLATEHAYESCHDVCDECAEDCEQDSCTECPINEAFKRLAAYEDTGLTPEEITALTAEPTVSKMEIVTLKKALDLASTYIVTLGMCDENLCDDISQEHHLKYQPKNDGNYENEPCIRCVNDYYIQQAQEEKDNAK